MEDNNAGNSEKTTKRVIGRPFPKGVSGNPSGRPKNTLKDFVRQNFMKMTDEQKAEWLKENKITGIDQWKMGEGNPENKSDITSGGEAIQQVLVKFIDGKQDDTTKDDRDPNGV